MTPTIAAAIADLEAQRGRIDQAIETLRGLNGHVAAPAPAAASVVATARRPRRAPATPAPAKQRRASGDGAGERGAALMKLLADKDQQSTKELAKAIGVSVYTARRELVALATANLVHETGVTNSLRWHRGAAGRRQPSKPAKEAP